MSIGALTSAFATIPKPATGIIGAPQVHQESASATQGNEDGGSTPPRVVFNPRSHYNASAGVFVMEYRSAKTGEIERQFPDEQQLRAYENARKLESAQDRGESVPKDTASDKRGEATAGEPKAGGAQKAASAPAQTGVRIQV